MRHPIFVLLMCGLAACGEPSDPHIENPVFDMPYTARQLDNGLQVIVIPTDYPDIVTLRIPVQTGVRIETDRGKSGFAHFFEHMMFRGTENVSAEEYARILAEAGAVTNATTWDDYTVYRATFTKNSLETMLATEADRFINLSLDEAVFRTEAQAVKGEFLSTRSNPVLAAFDRIRDLTFDVHPYSHNVLGTLDDIELMPEEIEYAVEFFNRWYRPEYTSVVVIGDVDVDETMSLVERYWGDWDRGTFVADVPREPPPSGPRYEHLAWPSDTRPWLFVGFRSPAFQPGEPDYPAMRVIDSVWFSESSDLYRKLVVEDGSVDTLLTDFPLNRDPNLNLVYLRLTDSSRAAEVHREVLNTFARARVEPISETVLNRTRERLRYSFAADLDSAESIGELLTKYVQFERSPETVNALYAGIDKLTSRDILDAANRYFSNAARVTVSVSSDETIAGLENAPSVDELANAIEIASTDTATEAEPDFRIEIDYQPRPGAPGVELVERHSTLSPLVDVAILFHVGAAMDPPGKRGLAALTAAMIADAGSAVRPIDVINAAHFPMASSFDAQTGKEMTRFSGQVHRNNLEAWYRISIDQLLDPGFRQSDFDRLKAAQIAALEGDLIGSNDEELAKEVLYSEIYGPNHPYGNPTLGLSAEIAALELDDVKRFYRRYYTVNNLTAGLSGGFAADFSARFQADLQSLPAGSRATMSVPASNAQAESRATIIEKNADGVAVSFGFPINIKRGDEDWLALWLARSWLGEHRSEKGRLYQRLRDARGLNYGDYAYIEYFPKGMFSMLPPTNLVRQRNIFQVWIRLLRSNADAHFATRAAVYEIQQLINNGMTVEDFERTRSFLSQFASQLSDGQTRQLGYAIDGRQYGTGEFAEYVRDGLAQLSVDDVNRVIRTYLRTSNIRYVFVTDDGQDLYDRLTSNVASIPVYDSDRPPGLIAEDQEIGILDLELRAESVNIKAAEDLFRGQPHAAADRR